MHGYQIRTGRNHLDGEVRVCRYAVNGFNEERRVLFGFHGCVFHGCRTCFPNRGTVNSYNKMNMAELYEKTVKKREKLTANGYEDVERWGCDWEELKENDDHVRQLVEGFGVHEAHE